MLSMFSKKPNYFLVFDIALNSKNIFHNLEDVSFLSLLFKSATKGPKSTSCLQLFLAILTKDSFAARVTNGCSSLSLVQETPRSASG